MKRLSLLLTVLLVTLTGSSAFAQFTQSQLVAEWQRAKAYTKEYLDAMPEDGYAFKPTPEIRSFTQQALHLADGNYLFASVSSGKASPLGHTLAAHDVLEKSNLQSKEEITKAVMDSYDFLISALQGITADQWPEAIKLGKRDATRSGLFGKAFEHQTHQRGQMTIYLRLKGVTPPAEKLF